MRNPVRRDTPQGRADLDPKSLATAREQATSALGASGRPLVPKACSIAQVFKHYARSDWLWAGRGHQRERDKSIQAPSVLLAGPKWPRGKYGGLGTEARGVSGEAQEGSYLCSGQGAVECGVWSVAHAAPPSGQQDPALTCPAGAGTSSRVH